MKYDEESFQKELEGVAPKICALFAYRCALRVFPLLAAEVNFDYWEEDKKRYLHSLFMVLDISVGTNRNITFTTISSVNAAAFASDVTSTSAFTVAAFTAADDATASASDAFSSAAFAAADISTFASDTSTFASDVSAVATAFASAFAASFAAARAIAAASSFSAPYKYQLLKSIQSDLKTVKGGNNHAALEDAPLWTEKTEIIRTAEERFKSALESDELDFSYWWGIYEQHARGSVDKEALEQRLTVPEEVKEQGAEFITDYLIKLSGKTSRLNEMRIIFMGDGGSGKTSLIRRLFGEDMSEQEESTTEIIIRDKTFKESGITGHLWDFGGQVMMHATHQLFLRERCIYVVVLDGRKEENPEYWLEHVKRYGNSSPVFIVKNKCDQGSAKDIPFNMLKGKYKNIVSNISLSCVREGVWLQTVEKFLSVLKNYLFEKRKDPILNPEIPQSFFKIKKRLEELKTEKNQNNEIRDCISYDTYRTICTTFNIREEKELNNLLGFFDSLGVLLKFKKNSEHVLNPDWLSVAAYRIVRSKKVQKNGGILNTSDLSEILKKKPDDPFEYHYTRYNFILKVLNDFKLLYFLDREENDNRKVLVPSLLPEDQIDNLDEYFDRSYGIHFIYDFSFLPPSVMTSFIVRAHADVSPELLWRHGVILTDSSDRENRALIIEDVNEKRIDILVQGSDPRAYLSCIRKYLREILNTSFTTTYHNNEEFYSELVPLGIDKNGKEVSIEYEVLLRMDKYNKTSFEEFRLMSRNEYGVLKPALIDVKEKLNGYSSPEQREKEAYTTVVHNYYGVNELDQRTYSAHGAGVVNQGDNLKTIMKDMHVAVGSGDPERQVQLKGADELIGRFRESTLHEKDKAIRFLENIKDEIDEEDGIAVKKQFMKLGNLLESAEATLIRQVKSFIRLFGVCDE